jgi:hypothetical protein
VQYLETAADLECYVKSNVKIYLEENYIIMKTLVTYFRDNSTPEDYLFLLGFITMAATVIRAVMLLNNNLLSVQLSSFLR